MSRPALAPGLRVQARGPEEIQVGLEPGTRLRVRATAAVRRALAALDRGEVPAPADRAALGVLAPVLVDADALAPTGIAPGDAAAAALADPTGFATRLAARRHRTVAVLGDLGELGDHRAPGSLLEAAGVAVGRDLGGRLPDAALVLSVGEPERELTDLLVHGAVPHLVLRLLEGTVVVGPLVVPGRTACLRCVDAHRADEDPLHPVLVATHHRAVRHDGVAEPGDAARVALGVAWAVRDLVTHLDGGRAACWSATVRIPVDLAALQVVRWLRHPACSCIWMAENGPSSTMAV